MSKRIAVAVLGAFLVACDQSTAPIAPPTTNDAAAAVGPGTPVYTGRGTAIDATVLGLNQKVCDVSVAQTGGSVSNSLAQLVIPGVLSTKVLYCNAQGLNDQALAEAGVYELILTVGGHTIFADVLTSMAAARCPPASSGNSSITRLSIDGQATRVGTTPNYVIPLSNGYIVINEQSSFLTPFHAGRTVTALRVVIDKPLPIADIKIARSQAHIDCPAV